ncbi:MAG: hypothetical protein WCO00_10630 [Rhodospirillaceae bacterium]
MASFDRSYQAGRSGGLVQSSARQRDHDRRRRLEPEYLHLETHFHSLIEQQAITRGRPLLHDVELERRLSAGHVHHESLC